MDAVYGFIKNLVAFLLLLTIIRNLLGQSSFKKYVGLYTGILFILLILTPVLNFFQKKDDMDWLLSKNFTLYREAELREKLNGAEKKQEDEIAQAYEKSIKTQIELLFEENQLDIKRCDVGFDKTENNYGALEKVVVKASAHKEETQNEIAAKVDIEKVELETKKKIEKQRNKKRTPYQEKIEKQMTQEVSQYFGLNEKNIEVIITKE